MISQAVYYLELLEQLIPGGLHELILWVGLTVWEKGSLGMFYT